MQHNMKNVNGLALWVILSLFASNSAAIPVYKVEILIFENSQATGLDGEQWRELTDRPSSLNSIPLSTGGEGAYQSLPATALNLIQARENLESSGKYEVIYHTGWSQPVKSREENTPVWIEVPGILEGTVNLHEGRYLHFAADLVFNSKEGSVRLTESRRLKAKELHYLDHPLFGILVRVIQL